jgi:hypothetical protein
VNGNIDSQSRVPNIFWGEIAPCEHIAQFYEHDGILLDTLTGFVGGGLKVGESCIVIATMEHLEALEVRLNELVDMVRVRSEDRYITVRADEALNLFMVAHWPDDQLFTRFVTGVITRARANGRSVRAFGEMVALLWARGDTAATIRLEYLWHQLCKTEAFSLLCAYPRTGFTEEPSNSMAQICAAHSRIV